MDAQALSRVGSDIQELIETWDDDGHDHSEDPYSDSVDRHVRIVSIGYGRSDFRIGRVFVQVVNVGTVQVRVIEMTLRDLFYIYERRYRHVD